MKVAGITTQQEVYIGSKDRNFRINEFLIIEDENQGDLIGEILEAKTFNRYIPLNIGGDFIDTSVLESLKAMGYDVNNETIYIGKLRLLKEALYPVLTGSGVRVPKFNEVKNLLLNIDTKDGLVLGVIRNTDDLTENMDTQYENICETFEDGKILKQKELPYLLDYRSMHEYPHIGVFGGSGSGKSFGLRVILEEIMQKNIPTIVLDPHYEMDFGTKVDGVDRFNYKDRYRCLQIGSDIGIKFEDLNKQDIKTLLNAASKLTDSMNNVVDEMFKTGNNYYSFFKKLTDLVEAQELGSTEKIEKRIDYADTPEEEQQWKDRMKIYEKFNSKCPISSVRGIIWRLNSLFHEGIFNRDITEVINSLKAGKLVVVQGSTRMIQVFSTYLLNKTYHERREYRDALYRQEIRDFFPPFIIVTDEAHNFAPKAVDTPSKSVLKEIAQEGRKYGVFLIFATQRPTLLDETITAQLNTKFIFRTVRASDIETIKEETDISPDEAKRLPYLSTGDVFISSSQKGRTSYVRIRAAHTKSPHKENPFDELKVNNKKESEEFFELIKYYFPIDPTNPLSVIQDLSKNHGINITMEEFNLKLEQLYNQGFITINETFLGKSYEIKED